MSSTVLPSLKEVTLTKVSLIIYKSTEFRDEYNKLRECKVKRPFNKARGKILEKFTNIIPKTVCGDISCCLDRIHKDVLDFARDCCMRIDNLKDFCWRPNGYLDKSETVRRLLENPKLFDRLHLLVLHMHASNQLKQFLS